MAVRGILIATGIPLMAAVSGAIALVILGDAGSEYAATERVPGSDRAPAAGAAARLDVGGAGKLTLGAGVAGAVGGAWPRFRGSAGDGIVAEAWPMDLSWGDAGPPVLWDVELGEGHAGAVVRDGRVYVLDYDQQAQANALRCLSLDDGREIWNFSYPSRIKRNHGMSRTVPAVTDKFVVAMDPKCHVVCCAADTGAFQWHLDLVGDYGAEVPPWYAGQCVLVDGQRVILAPAGGDALMLAADIATGEVLWETPNPMGWRMSHSSVAAMDVDGERSYAYSANGGVAGVAAADGRLLWHSSEWKIRIATIATPLPVGDGRLFLSGGYNSGSMMMAISRAGDAYRSAPVFRLEPDRFGSTQQTPILYQGAIYGVRPDGQFVCLGLDGELKWASGGGETFGLGPYLVVNGMLVILGDTGELVIAAAQPSGFNVAARARVLSGHDAWAPMAVADGKLLLRDLTHMVCIDLKGDSV